MRRLAAIVTAAALCVILSACGRVVPETTVTGESWDESWILIGNSMGVETPEGVDFLENNDALGIQDMYYASWTIGEGESYTDAEGEESEMFDGQIYVLLSVCGSDVEAAESADEWMGLAEESYIVESTSECEYNGASYTVLSYAYGEESDEENPYTHGVSAYGVCGNYAVSVELAYRDTLETPASEIMTSFLAECRFAA